MNPLGFLRDILAQISTASPWALLLTKVTLLLAVAWVVHFSLARANPRWRTLLWRGAVVGFVLLVVWALGLPGLEIRIQAPEPVATALAPSVEPMVAEREPAIPAVASVHPIQGPASVEMTATAHQNSVEVRPEAARPIESLGPSLSWRMALLGIWGFGVALLLVRLTIAYVRLASLLQTSQAASEEIMAEARRVAAALGCHWAVQVRSSRQYAVPFLYGLRRPVLVLPERMCQPAYRGQLPGIIAHELAHVGSWDFGWNAVLQAVSTILWFHPLAWRISSAHRAACDAVCDAISASYLGDVQGYCRTLARVALDGAASYPAAGLAMARTCDVRRRIAVLQQRVFAAALGRRAVVGVALVGLVSLALLAGVRLALAEPPPQTDADEGRRAYLRRLQRAETATPGHVADVEGRGIANATVKRANSSWAATTDAKGRFPLPELKVGETADLNISATGFVPMRYEVGVTYTGVDYVISGGWPIQLARPAKILGRVLAPDGKPLADAPLSLDTWVHLPQTCASTGNYAQAVTDAEGRFTLDQIPPGSHVLYYPGRAPPSIPPKGAYAIPPKGVYGALAVEPTDGQQLSGLVLDLSQSTASIEGRVFGPDGKPMAGASVSGSRFHEWNGMSGCTGPYLSSPRTDADGRYKITGIGPGQWRLCPSHPRFQRGQPSQTIALALGQTASRDLRVTERNDTENSTTRAAAEAERTDDLSKVNLCFYGSGLLPVDQNLAAFGRLEVMDLSLGGANHLAIDVKPLGLASTATPKQVARAAHAGELYFVPPDHLVMVNDTIIAPFTPPPDRRSGPYWGQMTRAEIVEQVEASRRQNPDADGRRIAIQKGENYIVVRSDGQGYQMEVGGVGKGGATLTFLYLGHLRLASGSGSGSAMPKSSQTQSADEPKPDDLSAEQIVDRMAKAYADCKSYRDSGDVTTLFVMANRNRTTEKPFTTAFVRPDRFRFEYKENDGSTKLRRYIIWSNGKDVQTWWDVRPGIEKPKSLGFALGSAAGVSGKSSHTIPSLLLPGEVGASLTAITDAKRVEDGKLEEVECFRVEGRFGNQPLTLWIDKKSYLVRRIDEQTTFDTFRTEQTTTYDPTINETIADKLLKFDPPAARKEASNKTSSDDGTTSLAEAVRAINQQAAKLPESRTQKPLTEDQVVKSIDALARDSRLSDAEYRELKRIAETRRLPKNVNFRQFVRYNDGTCVQHGWWVRLMLLRDGQGTFSLTIRQESVFRRPYTQQERLFQDEFRRTGTLPTMNRLVAYFDEDPKFGTVQGFSPQEADRLADAVKKAINDRNVDDLLKIFHWEKVDQRTRAAVRSEAEQFVKRQISSVSVSPQRFGGRLHHWQGLKTWDPNLPVLGYIALEFADGDGLRSVWLEFGETPGGARLVNYIVSQDDGPRMVGKRLSGPISVTGIPMVPLADGWFEMYLKIEAPDELPALQNANLELWRVQPTPRAETPRAEK